MSTVQSGIDSMIRRKLNQRPAYANMKAKLELLGFEDDIAMLERDYVAMSMTIKILDGTVEDQRSELDGLTDQLKRSRIETSMWRIGACLALTIVVGLTIVMLSSPS